MCERYAYSLGHGAWRPVRHQHLPIPERENGTFKKVMVKAKSAFFAKKRTKGLPNELLLVEIVMVARQAMMNSFMILAFAEAVLARRGWNPFNRARLDMPEILETATEEVKRSVTLCYAAGGLIIL